jgi:hypothetical protein
MPKLKTLSHGSRKISSSHWAGAEIHGWSSLDDDKLNHTLGIPAQARNEYDHLPKRMRDLCDAFAAGLNYYLAHHPEIRPKLLARMEPWYPLALIRYQYCPEDDYGSPPNALEGKGLEVIFGFSI